MEKPQPPRPSSFLTVLGLVLTLLYLVGAIEIIAHGEISLESLKANELGDFLAGVFAPIAFLWLVLGFFLQRQELSHSSAALWLQSEELAKSVEHQRELAEQTRRQVDAELQAAKRAMEQAEFIAQPVFAGTIGGTFSGDLAKFKVHIRNGGATCSNIVVTLENEIVARSPIFSQDSALEFSKRFEHHENIKDVSGLITYIDNRGMRMGRKFAMLLIEKGGPNERHTLSAPEFEAQLLRNLL